ncbi:MAG: cbb3-type cytochrome oxidase assembly protein CcoS [Deltaproteobacteria bacterium]|nr:cbb3-type cytochrome oxidase assembly protein CcoS [Deltaproteobacteria bacterium]MBW2476010.1 cbb3-type cytochrome oxidase assembly protein CcoS [Deltaproteobacteria bacterium]MBW2503941.1 cbb3-type cytochrome oxidase assembly protein CcoS [Deltaproteobacteria bacterium]MBW2518794.1 cbb3-type cytochrome oxidase assembly protein CcoS [Deltaproteobacteria bacterium]
MFQSTIILIILSLCVGFGAWLVFIWAVKKGEFDDVEGPKYRMLDEEDDFPERSAKSEGEAHED